MTKSASANGKETKKILIIEDEGEMCLLLNIILDSKEMELDHVKTIEKATAYLEKNSPSVIILDNKLPDGLGVDFIRYIKDHDPKARIIMISGYGASAKDEALHNGADIFMEKPFTRDQLYKSINTLTN